MEKPRRKVLTPKKVTSSDSKNPMQMSLEVGSAEYQQMIMSDVDKSVQDDIKHGRMPDADIDKAENFDPDDKLYADRAKKDAARPAEANKKHNERHEYNQTHTVRIKQSKQIAKQSVLNSFIAVADAEANMTESAADDNAVSRMASHVEDIVYNDGIMVDNAVKKAARRLPKGLAAIAENEQKSRQNDLSNEFPMPKALEKFQ